MNKKAKQFNISDFMNWQEIDYFKFKESDVADFKNSVKLYKINEIRFDEKYPRREAFENIIASVNNHQINFIYLLIGKKDGIDLYLGVVQNYYNKGKELEISEYGSAMKDAIIGNYLGTKISEVDENEFNKITSKIENFNKRAIITGIPSIAEENIKVEGSFQGVDRLINTMLGEEWMMMIVCESVKQDDIDLLISDVYNIYDKTLPDSKGTVNASTNSTTSEGTATTEGRNHSKTTGTGTNKSETNGTGTSKSKQTGTGTNKSETNGTGTSKSKQTGTGTNRGDSENSKTTSDSKTEGGSTSESSSDSKSTTDSKSESISTSSSVAEGTNSSESETNGNSESTSSNKSESNSTGKAITTEFTKKEKIDLLKYIDDDLLPRLKSGKGKGLFKTATYILTKKDQTLYKIEKAIQSIFQGDKSFTNPLVSNSLKILKKGDKKHKILTKKLSHFQLYKADAERDQLASIYTIPYDKKQNLRGISTYLTSKEISLMANFPQKEVPGLSLKCAVDFGLNIPLVEDGIRMGHILQRGAYLEKNIVKLNKNHINKHIFICGVTGSGKTTTSQKLLIGSKIPFLVIEPAKTEYRTLINEIDDIVFFTPGREDIVPFRFNPFEMLEGENITSHIDMLIATFNASFPMEASMPYILKEAIYKIYEKYGWDFESSSNIFDLSSRSADIKSYNGLLWPTIKDLIKEIEIVIKSKGFSERLEGEYIGTFNSRLTDLTIGTRGKIFNCRVSVDFQDLLNKNVVIELENLKDESDKALLMGFVLARMNEALKIRHKKNPKFRHITLIEEAHRLLSKPSHTDTGAKHLSVQTFTDMLAESRKYGEGIIIIDQIPNKLATEVLKNTNTKIIHKIFAKDDKESIGDTIGLNNEQKDFLSSLETGETIMYSEGWHKPVYVKIDRKTETSHIIEESKVIELGYKYILSPQNRDVYIGFCHGLDISQKQLKKLIVKLNFQLKRFILPNLSLLSDKVDKKENDEEFFTNFEKDMTSFASFFRIKIDKLPFFLSNLVIERLGILSFYSKNQIIDIKKEKESLSNYLIELFSILQKKEKVIENIKKLKGTDHKVVKYDWLIKLKEL